MFQKAIGIIGALEAETQELISKMQEKSVKIMLGYEPCFEFLKNVYKETSRNTELVCPFNKKEKVTDPETVNDIFY